MVLNVGWGCVVCGLWVSIFDVFWFLFGVLVLGGGFWPQVSILCACARARAWLGAFDITTGEKKHFNKCEIM